MSPGTVLILFAAGAAGGAINAFAGGGSFVAFPVLLFVGVPPVAANATNCVALFIGTTASGGAFKSRFPFKRSLTVALVVTSTIGGLLGAFLLIRTPSTTFLKMLPWLMLTATLLFAFGRPIGVLLSGGRPREPGPGAIVGASLFELVVALYGGFFGGGIGIMNLAMFSILGMTDMQAMNAFKVVLVGIINGTASATFAATHAVSWAYALPMTLGAILGGYGAARYHEHLPQSFVRVFVIVVGTAMTAYFFWRY